MADITYYHVAGGSWEPGDDLMTWESLKASGIEGVWKWEDAEEGFDGDVVCLFDAIEDAREFRRDFGGAAIVAVTLDVEDGRALLSSYERAIERNAEGYLCIRADIPAQYLSVVE